MKINKLALAAGPAAALPLLTAYVAHERHRPRPMSPVWSFTLEGKARVARADQTVRDSGVEPGLEVLEVGCGPGVMLEAAVRRGSPGAVHAVDIQPEMAQRARRRLAERALGEVDIRTGDAGALPYPDDRFDLVYMVTVIGEFPEPLLEQVERIRLGPGVQPQQPGVRAPAGARERAAQVHGRAVGRKETGDDQHRRPVLRTARS